MKINPICDCDSPFKNCLQKSDKTASHGFHRKREKSKLGEHGISFKNKTDENTILLMVASDPKIDLDVPTENEKN